MGEGSRGSSDTCSVLLDDGGGERLDTAVGCIPGDPDEDPNVRNCSIKLVDAHTCYVVFCWSDAVAVAMQ